MSNALALPRRAGLAGLAPWTSAALLLALMLALGACNTMGGAGEDVEAAGDAMSDTAEDVEDDM